MKFSDSDWKEFVAGLEEKGWLPDIVEQINDDRDSGVERTYVLTINDAARYQGLSRYGVEKLIASGKLRVFTIAPSYRSEQPAQRIPAKDVLALN